LKHGARGSFVGVLGGRLVDRQGKDEPTALGELLQPEVHRTSGSSIDIDNVCLLKRRCGAVTVDDLDIHPRLEIDSRASCELGIEFDRSDVSADSYKLSNYCSVVADPYSNVHDMFACLGRSVGRETGVKGRLAVIELALGNDADHAVCVEMHWVIARYLDVGILGSFHLPGARAQKVLARHARIRILKTRIIDLGGGRDLFGVCTSDGSQLGISIHGRSLYR
jgi:hypothetical protein